MFSPSWTKFELKSLDGLVPKGPAQPPADPFGAFVPLCGNEPPSAGKKAAELIVKEAEEKAAHLAREAYDKGFGQGERDGLELGRKKAEKLVSRMERLLEELGGLKQELARIHEQEILAVVFAIAEKIIQNHVLRDDDLVRRTVVAAFHRATDRGEIALRINPEEVQFIETAKPELFGRFKDVKRLSVIPDPSVSRGGCVLESPCGDVDGRIETQLDEIRKVLEETFRQQDAQESRE